MQRLLRVRATRLIRVVAIVSVAAVLGACGADDDGDDTVSPPATTTTTDVAPVPFGPEEVVYPDATSDSSFDDPADLTRAFAIDLGFTAPVVGDLRPTGGADGEIVLRPAADGPETVVHVRRRAPVGDWWVLGTTTDGIVADEPTPLATVDAPLRLHGTSTAFEANVTVEVRQDGSSAPLGLGWVMGGSNGEMGPFDGALAYSVPSASDGVVVLSTQSMEDGGTWEATVVRVHFDRTSTCGGLSAPPLPEPEQMLVTVAYTCGGVDPGAEFVPVHRVVPRTTGVLRADLEALVAGPTHEEREHGLESWFSAATAGTVQGVALDDDGHATVDFADLRPIIPNASASAGSQLLLSQLDAAVFQHPEVRTAEYRIAGSCEAFTEWLQLGGCDPRTAPS